SAVPASLPGIVFDEPFAERRVGRANIVWVTGPELVEEVLIGGAERFHKTSVEKRVLSPALGKGLLTSDGPAWRWQRRTAAPLFRPQDLTALVPAMAAEGERIVAAWAAKPGERTIAVEHAMGDLTFRIIASTMFSGDGLEVGDLIQNAGRRYLGPVTWEIAAGQLRLPDGIWHPGRGRMRRAARDLRSIVAMVISRRRAEGGERRDLLGRLMSARDPETGEPMSEEQLIDNMVTFYMAGHETTAVALTWTLYLLARAPAWQELIRAEAAQVAGRAPIEASHIDRLVVTRRVLKEAMRIYPPVAMMARTIDEPTTLGSHRLHAPTLVLIPIFAIHRHNRLWEDPKRFDPDRFLPAAEARHARTQWMPFGYGPRVCIGATFAMLEATALLATLVRGARFGWDGRHTPEPVSRVTLRPKGGMPLQVTPIS
ncbi:MAG TPA: cytochrome P450, partial [Hyphomicrobiaceae bacterium]|nr:cytochrome P450 [Hyphomicrobiaceae bacterium]